MTGDFLPVAQLMAVLGLNATPMTEALGDAEISLKEFQGTLNTAVNAIKRGMDQASAETHLYHQAVRQATDAVGSEAEAIELLSTTLQEYTQSQAKAVEASRLEAESYAATAEMQDRLALTYREEMASQREYAALKAQINKEELAATAERQAIFDEQVAKNQAALQEEAASRQEYTNLIKELAAEETAAEIAEQETSFRNYMETLQARLAARKAEIAEERYLSQQADEIRRAESRPIPTPTATSPGGGSTSGGYAGIGLRVGAGGISPSLRAGMFGLGEAIAPVFPIIMAAAFVDILVVEGKRVVELIEDWEGFGKAQKKAWDEAFDGAERSRIELIKVTEAWRELNAAGLKGKSKDLTLAGDKRAELADTEKQLQAQIALQRVQDSAIGLEKMKPSAVGSSIGAAIYIADRLVENSKTLEELEKDRAVTHETIVNLTKLEGEEKRKIIEDERKAVNEREKSERKFHDRIHESERASRVPWFQGGGLAGPGGLLPVYTGGWGSSVAGMGMQMPRPPIGNLSRSMMDEPIMQSPRSSTTPSSGGGSSGGGQGVNIQITIAPSFKFDGIPADIEKFMRDEAEPRLAEHMSRNTRGITDEIVRALVRKGVQVSG